MDNERDRDLLRIATSIREICVIRLIRDSDNFPPLPVHSFSRFPVFHSSSLPPSILPLSPLLLLVTSH